MSDSPLYDTITTTIHHFITSMAPTHPGSNTLDPSTILSILTPDFSITFGPDLFRSTMPHLQGRKDSKAWLEIFRGLTSSIVTWTTELTDLVVDVRAMRAVVRSTFRFEVREGRIVASDLVQFVRLDKKGERIVEVVEFLDGTCWGEFEKARE